MLMQTIPIEYTTIDDFKANDFRSFLENVDRGGRHGPREDATYVCMVTPRSGEEYYLFGVGVKHGCNYCYIWEVALKDMR